MNQNGAYLEIPEIGGRIDLKSGENNYYIGKKELKNSTTKNIDSNYFNSISSVRKDQNSNQVLKQQFIITQKNDKYYIEDPISTNGTYLGNVKLKGKTPQLLNEGSEIIVPVEDQGKLTQLKIIFHFTQNLQKSSNLSITQAKSSTNQSSSGGKYYDPTRAPTTAPTQDYSSIPVVRRVNAVYYDPDDPSNTSNSFILIKKQLTVPPNAFRPDSGLDLSMIYKLEKSEFWHIMVAFVLLFVTIYHTYINLMGIMALINYISSGAPYVTWQMAFIDTIPMALIFCFSFLIHELSHLETGRHYKFQSRFCLTNVGVKTTLKSAIIGLPFALPGAAVSVGVDPEKDKDKMGAIKIAGPLSNLIFGIVLISIAYFLPTDFARVKNILVQGSSLNFVLGAFNMIPAEFKGFALDGKYIRTWKFTYYLILLILLIGSYVGSIILSQDYQKLMTA